ncbi:hypothetical protein [Fodinibacter luteus]|uniref:hypothetical protein n=1 Tax=Fodinibacter luteus TaxID=552064 RepID=UPI0031E7120A
MTNDRAAEERWEDAVRGLMLGLALGDSAGRGLGSDAGRVIRSGVSAGRAATTPAEHRHLAHHPSGPPADTASAAIGAMVMP